MAYYRRRNYKYRPRRRFARKPSTPWYNKKYSVAQMAGAALKGVNYIKGLVNSEMHKHDLTSSGTVDNNGTLVNLNAIATGDTDSTRTGNSIYVRHVNASGSLEINSSATASQVRCMLIVDKQQIGDTSPSVTDVLETTGSAFAPFSKLNSETVGRFSILWSRVYNLNTQRPSVVWSCRKTMRHHVRYNGSASTDIQRGCLYLLFISSESVNNPTCRRNIRVSYHDN